MTAKTSNKDVSAVMNRTELIPTNRTISDNIIAIELFLSLIKDSKILFPELLDASDIFLLLLDGE